MVKGMRSRCYEDVGLEGHRRGATPKFDAEYPTTSNADGDLRQFLPQSFYDHSAQ